MKPGWLNLFQKVRWRLTLSYLLVTLAAIFMFAWWGLVVAILYLQRLNPDLSWLEVLQFRVLPVLAVVIPSVLLLALPAALVSAYFGFLTARWFDQRLANLHQATQSWQQGDFSIRVEDPTADEIGEFGHELNAMAGELQRLLKARADLAALEERTHLSRDLHDSVKQHITAAAFQISSAHALLDHSTEAARASLVEAENLVHTAHQDLNTILFELRPVTLAAGDLAQTLREYTGGWSRQNPIQVQVQARGDTNLPAPLQQELLRFVQEALSNVARHSRAGQVLIDLHAADGELTLTIQDDGVGFQPGAPGGSGYGLQSMRDRVQRAGGQLSLSSLPGQGTRVVAAVPLPSSPQDGQKPAKGSR